MVETRNPMFIPEREERSLTGCPKCESKKFGGRMVQGVVTFTCSECKNQWTSGVVSSADPRVPYPIDRYVPPVRFEKSLRGDEHVEVERRVDLTQDFRKGGPIEGDE